MYKILFADDDSKISEAVFDYFTANGFSVTLAKNGEEAVWQAFESIFDLIILDVMMPVIDGISACRKIRKYTKAPILFMSALGEEQDLLDGYGAGADDYIIKPFPLSVLCKKSLTVIRRSNGVNQQDILNCGGITLNITENTVIAGETDIRLTHRDFEILQYLMSRKNTVLSRSIILSRAWGYDFDGDERVVDTHIKNIRKALGEYGEVIKTVSGLGYKFEVK